MINKVLKSGLISLALLSTNAFADYNLKCSSSFDVLSNSDGSHHIKSSFNLFNGNAASADLNISAFNVNEDGGFVYPVNIIPPYNNLITKLDVVFLLDISGSMSGEISGLKNSIGSFVSSLNQQDTRLGLITFGGYRDSYNGISELLPRNGGNFYSSVNDFKNQVSALSANGGYEAWYDAIAIATTEYSFRNDAKKVLIVITDEWGNGGETKLDSSIKIAQNNGMMVIPVSPNFSSTNKVAQTFYGGSPIPLGRSGNVDFSQVLAKVSQIINNMYVYEYNTLAGEGEHTVKVIITQNQNYDECKYELNAGPKIIFDQSTTDAIKTGVKSDTPFYVGADISDKDGVKDVWIEYKLDNNTTKIKMVDDGSGLYSSNEFKLAENKILSFKIIAVDTKGKQSVTNESFISAVNNPPLITNITPNEFEYEKELNICADISDPDGDDLNVTIEYQKSNESFWTSLTPSVNGSNYCATTSKINDFKSINVRVSASDSKVRVDENKTLNVMEIPVAVKDVTTILDTFNTGPFSIYAVAKSAQSVDIEYKVNGGSIKSTPLSKSMKRDLASSQDIWSGEDFGIFSPGDKIEYWATASNASGATAESRHQNFEIFPTMKPVTIEPSFAEVMEGESIEFVAKNGFDSSYTFNSNMGETQVNGATATVKTNLAGSGTIVVKDAKGVSATADIKVVPTLDILDSNKFDGKDFAKNSEITLKGMGGIEPYSWVVSGANSSVSDDKTETTITLGEEATNITITLKDSKNHEKSISFTNQGTLEVDVCTNGIYSANEGEEVSISAIGGENNKYEWSAIGGDIKANEGDITSATYTAPNSNGVYSFSVTDGTQIASCTVKVGTELKVTPLIAFINKDESATFEVVTGNAPYTWNTIAGKVTPTTGEKVTFTPDKPLGLYTLYVEDLTGSAKELSVVVVDKPIISPSMPTLKLGESIELSVSGGSSGYTWSYESGKLDTNKGDTVTYTAPNKSGKYTIKATDSFGNEASVTVNVIVENLRFDITPDTKVLEPEGSVTLEAKNGTGTITWVATSGNVDNGIYTAPDVAGTYKVTAIDEVGNQDSSTIEVIGSLTLTKTSIKANQGEEVALEVKGGKGPYIWKSEDGELSSSEDSSITYTAPATIGSYNVTVYDAKGDHQTATIVVGDAPSVTPASVTLAAGGTQKFIVNGTSTNFTWSVDEGDLDTTIGESVIYTAPSTIGTYTIKVTDEAGQIATTTVTVGNIPILTPANSYVSKGENVDLEIVGGNAPYSWSSDIGTLSSTNGKNVTFSAPNKSDIATVTIRDRLGQEDSAKIYIDAPLMASKEKVFIDSKQSTKLSALGGVAPFTWTTISGDIEYLNDKHSEVVYTSPNVYGDDTITLSDSTGKSTTVDVKVTTPLAVSPFIRYMKRGESKKFTIIGGIKPYSNPIIADSDGDVSEINENGEFTYTAPNVADKDVEILVRDNEGSEFRVHAYVERKIRITPSESYLGKGESFNFKMSGGTGGFEAFATSGQVEVNSESGKGTYTAPNRIGTYEVTVTDSSDQEATINVVVEKSTPVISPSKVIAKPGDVVTMFVNRGSAPYDWAGTIAPKVLDEAGTTVQFSVPKQAGTYSVNVEDAAGNGGKATIEVTLPFAITPSARTIFYSTKTPKIEFEAIGGVAPYTWTYNDLEKVSEGDNNLIVKANAQILGTTYSVTGIDAEGVQATANIVVVKLVGDSNGDGKLSKDEMVSVLDSYTKGEVTEALAYKHIEYKKEQEGSAE